MSEIRSVNDVVEELKAGLARDMKIVEESNRELEALREVADKIYALQCELHNASTRVYRVLEMLSDKSAKSAILENPAFSNIHEWLREGRRKPTIKKVTMRGATEAYLDIVKEAKVGEIVEFLQSIGMSHAKRQSIESVIKRNPFDFKVTKRGREKFISANHSAWWDEVRDMPPPPKRAANEESC